MVVNMSFFFNTGLASILAMGLKNNLPATAELRAKATALANAYPDFSMRDQAGGFEIMILDVPLIVYMAHLTRLTRRFLDCAFEPQSLTAWENADMLAKCCVTAQGVTLARQSFAKAHQP